MQSHAKFLAAAWVSGPAGYGGSDDELDSYCRICEEDASSEYSFPFKIALLYDIPQSAYLAAVSRPGYYPINFYYQTEDFTVLNGLFEVEKNKHVLKDKIVLIGYMESTEEDYFPTPTKPNSKTFGTVVLANIILNILDDLDSAKINPTLKKYSDFLRDQQQNETK